MHPLNTPDEPLHNQMRHAPRLWRANGATVRYKDLIHPRHLYQLIHFVQQSAAPKATDGVIF